MGKRARAIIIKEGKILLIERVRDDGSYWVLPGGGVEEGEREEQALVRECKEELGLDVKVIEPFLVRTSDKPGMEDQVEHFFLVSIVGGSLGTGTGPEFGPHTTYVGKHVPQWVNLLEVNGIDLKPNEVRDMIYKKFSK